MSARPEDEALAIAGRAGLPFVGLRDHRPGPEFDDLLPLEVAREVRVVPLAVEGDVVRVASPVPDPDLDRLRELLRGRRVELAIARRDEVDALLGPPPRRPARGPGRVREPEAPAAPAPRGGRRRRLLVALLLLVLAAAVAAFVVLVTRGNHHATAARTATTVPAPAPPRPPAVSLAPRKRRATSVVVDAVRGATLTLSASRLRALAEVCGGRSDAGLVDRAPTAAELRACPLLRTITTAGDRATVVVRRGGGCVVPPRARDLARHPGGLDAARRRARAKAAFDRRHRLQPVAVRDRAGRCVTPSPATIATADYPLADRLVLVAAVRSARRPEVVALARALRARDPRVTTVAVGRAS